MTAGSGQTVGGLNGPECLGWRWVVMLIVHVVLHLDLGKASC